MKNYISIFVRIKDEPFMDDFIKYYINENIDMIYIWDDNSTLTYSNFLYSHLKVQFFKQIDYNTPQDLYEKIKNNTEWMLFIDADEFITTRLNLNNTIKDEIKQNFDNYDVVKIPWVMFSSNNRKNDPSHITDLITRWDHNKRHPHSNDFKKGRCRFTNIECKCIFKTNKFNKINEESDHYPNSQNGRYQCVDSINKTKAKLKTFYRYLNEDNIKNAHLVCFHYRLISEESCIRKIKTNKYYTDLLLSDMLECDYNEIEDKTIFNKMKKIL